MAPVTDMRGLELTTEKKKQWATEFSRVTGGKICWSFADRES